MSYNYELRLVAPQGGLGRPLPDAANLSFLDDDVDVGTLQFDYPIGGRNSSALELRQEVAVLIDGEKISNGNYFIEEFTGNTVNEDGKPIRTWAATSLLGRLDECLIMPLHDQHTREDVRTQSEQEEFEDKRQEWYEQAKKAAIKEAKEKAKEHNDAVRDRRKGGKKGGGDKDVKINKNVNRWGKHAIRWATNQVANPSQNWYHLCQSFVRQSFGLPGIYGTAREAWFSGTKRTNTPINKIPAGVPVYWAPNHVALSIGGGDCISTDVLRAGEADIVPIASLHNGVNWNLTFRGWSTEVSGRKIYP